MEYFFAIKNEVQIYATTWVNSENIMLSKVSQSQETTYCLSPFTGNVYYQQI